MIRAKFTFLGRAGLYRVSAAGLAGARRVIEILRTEIDVNLAQMGWPYLAALGWDFVHDQSRVTKGWAVRRQLFSYLGHTRVLPQLWSWTAL